MMWVCCSIHAQHFLSGLLISQEGPWQIPKMTPDPRGLLCGSLNSLAPEGALCGSRTSSLTHRGLCACVLLLLILLDAVIRPLAKGGDAAQRVWIGVWVLVSVRVGWRGVQVEVERAQQGGGGLAAGGGGAAVGDGGVGSLEGEGVIERWHRNGRSRSTFCCCRERKKRNGQKSECTSFLCYLM